MARIVEENEFADMPGQDSFLDVLTNIVGIIILLVVVVGLRTSRSVVEAASKQVQVAHVDDSAIKELVAARAVAVSEERELEQMVRQAVEIGGEATLRMKERNYLTTYVTAFDQELKDRRAELTVDEQRDFDLRRQLAEAQEKLEDVSRTQVALLSQPTEVEAIENQPTPLARNAPGRRVMLYLAGGHVAVVPEEELAKEIIPHAQENMWRLKDSDHYIGTVGPIGGFRFRYLVGSVDVQADVPAGVPNPSYQAQARSARVASIIRYRVLPESDRLGEPVSEAIRPNSALRQVLRENPSDTAVVLIAVYADSIKELHELKRFLHEERYATAESPFREGEPLDVAVSRRRNRSSSTFVQ